MALMLWLCGCLFLAKAPPARAKRYELVEGVPRRQRAVCFHFDGLPFGDVCPSISAHNGGTTVAFAHLNDITGRLGVLVQ